MIKTNQLLIFSILISPIFYSYAATEQTSINVEVTHDEYVHLIGTAVGSSHMYSNYDIANWIFPNVVDIGTLGLESNLVGNCDFSISTQNNFKLLHTVSGDNLTDYKIIYQSQEFFDTSNPSINLSCNLTPSIIQFSPTALVFGNFLPSALIQTGTYSDTVTIVVTTQ